MSQGWVAIAVRGTDASFQVPPSIFNWVRNTPTWTGPCAKLVSMQTWGILNGFCTFMTLVVNTIEISSAGSWKVQSSNYRTKSSSFKLLGFFTFMVTKILVYINLQQHISLELLSSTAKSLRLSGPSSTMYPGAHEQPPWLTDLKSSMIIWGILIGKNLLISV